MTPNTLVALRRVRPPGWKCGQSPQTTIIAEIPLPADWDVETADRIASLVPGCNGYRAYDHRGEWACTWLGQF